jgi:hypothetical protein
MAAYAPGLCLLQFDIVPAGRDTLKRHRLISRLDVVVYG